jgi:lipopolysaccharide transport system ATP-binding protein
MADTVIRAKNLSKIYRIGQKESYYTFRDRLVQTLANPLRWIKNNLINKPNIHSRPDQNFIWALKDISFEIKQGEVAGIIGRNGAGKTTLLKILSRITEPTQGYAQINGRVGSLLEVGTGFHPELTGRDNIYLNGAILGMRKAEIKRKFDEIVAFSEIEKFIDTPVKHYSSGMYVRLAFAVAAHLEPEILLVDEVLAVGDVSFQKKCLGKMDQVAKEGRTVLFVSHNMAAINRLCNQTLWIDAGCLHLQGETEKVIAAYLSEGSSEGGEVFWKDTALAPGDEDIRLRAVRILNHKNEISDTLDILQPLSVEVEYEVKKTLPPIRIVVRVTTIDGVILFLSRDNYNTVWQERSRSPGIYVSRCEIPPELLNAGCYTVTVSAELPFVKIFFLEEHVLRFSVQRTGGTGAEYSEPWPGIICPSLKWEVKMLE